MKVFSNIQVFWTLAKESVLAWIDDYAPSMGAALAFYTLFSVGPLLIIVISVAGLVFGEAAAQGEVVAQLRQLLGEEGAVAVQGLLKSVSEPFHGMIAAIVSIATLLLGATTVLAELQSALDRIWKSPALKQPTSVWSLVSIRLWAFGMILGFGFLLLVSLVVSAALAAVGKWWAGWFGGWQSFLQVTNFAVSFGLITTAFAMMYKFLPRVSVAWGDVWIGAAWTALLFTIGKFFIGMYLGRSAVASAFGAAGSLVILLLWVYYSAQIFLLGAEFTRLSARRGARGPQQNEPGASPASAAPITMTKCPSRHSDLKEPPFRHVALLPNEGSKQKQHISINRLVSMLNIGILVGAILGHFFIPTERSEAQRRRK